MSKEMPATPIAGKTKPIAATTSNSVVTLTVNSPQIIINALASNTVEMYFRTGKTAAEAVAVVASSEGDYPILAGTVQTFTKPDDHLYIGFITASGTAAGWVSPCNGE